MPRYNLLFRWEVESNSGTTQIYGVFEGAKSVPLRSGWESERARGGKTRLRASDDPILDFGRVTAGQPVFDINWRNMAVEAHPLWNRLKIVNMRRLYHQPDGAVLNTGVLSSPFS